MFSLNTWRRLFQKLEQPEADVFLPKSNPLDWGNPLDCHPGAGKARQGIASQGKSNGYPRPVVRQGQSMSEPTIAAFRRDQDMRLGCLVGRQHSSVCICSGLPTKIKASLFHRLLWTAASNDSGPASQHTIVCVFVLWYGTQGDMQGSIDRSQPVFNFVPQENDHSQEGSSRAE